MKQKLVLLLLTLIYSCSGNSQELNLEISDQLWQEDFQFLKKKVEKTLPTYNTSIDKKSFEFVYEALMNSDLGANKKEVVFGVQRLMNALNDEGCSVPLFQKGLDFEVLPIKAYWFNDGLYVLDANTDNTEIIGEQIVKINNTAIEQVFTDLKPLLNADNDYYKKYLFQIYGFMPSLLKVVGLGDSDNEIQLEFASGKTKTVNSASISEYSKLKRVLPNDEYFSFTKTNHDKENYWFEFIPNTKTLFIQLQAIVNNEEGNSFSEFVNEVEELINSKKLNKLIIDVRYGGGGNGFKLKKFTDLLRGSELINKKGKLFVLTSKATRGTLLELASILSLNTKAIIVGKPTAEGANTVGDIKYITLPNSGLKVSVTHTFWPTTWKQDANTTLEPSVPVVYSYSDSKAENDPWISKALSYEAKELGEDVSETLAEALIGTYKVEGRKIAIERKNGKLFMTMNRKMKSFFEISTQLYHQSHGVISTDIDGVFLKYKEDGSGIATLQHLQWKELKLKIN